MKPSQRVGPIAFLSLLASLATLAESGEKMTKKAISQDVLSIQKPIAASFPLPISAADHRSVGLKIVSQGKKAFFENGEVKIDH